MSAASRSMDTDPRPIGFDFDHQLLGGMGTVACSSLLPAHHCQLGRPITDPCLAVAGFAQPS